VRGISLHGIILVPKPSSPISEGDRHTMRVQIYTNDREQPIDLEVLEMRTKAREINANGDSHQRELPVDQTIREVIKDPAIGASANLLFTTPDGKEGAIYLNTEKVAAVITSWPSVHSPAE
jgi:hypothetical protein